MKREIDRQKVGRFVLVMWGSVSRLVSGSAIKYIWYQDEPDFPCWWRPKTEPKGGSNNSSMMPDKCDPLENLKSQ